ncbi:hypothetical protein, partial [Erwinia amylovora]|uniref:hypothetical protein n=1 Tax=Erwinia amylovora TaxID=552 RepID=UPI001C559275
MMETMRGMLYTEKSVLPQVPSKGLFGFDYFFIFLTTTCSATPPTPSAHSDINTSQRAGGFLCYNLPMKTNTYNWY